MGLQVLNLGVPMWHRKCGNSLGAPLPLSPQTCVLLEGLGCREVCEQGQWEVVQILCTLEGRAEGPEYKKELRVRGDP